MMRDFGGDGSWADEELKCVRQSRFYRPETAEKSPRKQVQSPKISAVFFRTKSRAVITSQISRNS